ncbi:MAG: hydrogenase maturation nickel metallochaperone HypA [Nitrospira sp.]|nr:hydrogenase maturation nickel metallochaperone HypA [Nitrospira sp.]MDH5626485.1 hydrogenase maturation nickel metallochaperone HypA [Nitrospira sp.]
MHEVHLMGQVVKAVNQALREANGAKPSVVRLKVSALSHLLDHDPSQLQTAFDVASLGTTSEGATLDIERVPVDACCRRCGAKLKVSQAAAACNACGSLDLDVVSGPEVVVHDVTVTE